MKQVLTMSLTRVHTCGQIQNPTINVKVLLETSRIALLYLLKKLSRRNRYLDD